MLRSVVNREVDTDHSNTISFAEFVQMMHNLRAGRLVSTTSPHSGVALSSKPTCYCSWARCAGLDLSLSRVVKKAGHLLQVQGAGGAQHSFSEEEKVRGIVVARSWRSNILFFMSLRGGLKARE